MSDCRAELRQECRSLLQKAVRRGDSNLVSKVISRLANDGDTNWIRIRTAIIVFEECWPLGKELVRINEVGEGLRLLNRAAGAVKIKDAAGLGSLALALAQNDRSMLEEDINDRHIRLVAEAIRRPEDFWKWLLRECMNSEQLSLAVSARAAFRRGGWLWDRAFAQAAAYLAVTVGIPKLDFPSEEVLPCPYWIAIDKHTSRGKQALREVAKAIGLHSEQMFWISFYCESAVVNTTSESVWWQKEVNWRLGTVGLQHDQAIKIWQESRPLVCDMLKEDSDHLREYIENAKYSRPRLFA